MSELDGYDARNSPHESSITVATTDARDSRVVDEEDDLAIVNEVTRLVNSRNGGNSRKRNSKNTNTTDDENASSLNSPGNNNNKNNNRKSKSSSSEYCVGKFTKRMCAIIWYTIALLLLLAFGIIGVFGGEWIATLAMESQMVLTSYKTQLFKTWQNEANMDINIYRQYYFFNLTNPREVYYDRVAPDFRVIGPFVYKTNRDRPMWSMFWDTEDNANFRYHDYQYWTPERSKDEIDGRQLHENDTITSINMALFTATYRISKIPDFVVHVAAANISKQDVCLLVDLERLAAEHRALGPKGIFTQRTAKEWLFGFQDETLQMLHDGSKIIDYHVPTEFKLQFNDSIPAPGPISFRHGQVCPLANFEENCNSSMTADSSVTSGRKWDPEGKVSPVVDIKHVGTLQTWAGNENLWWFGEEGDCQRIRGTEGLFVGTNVDKTDVPEIYVDGIYRSVKLGYVRDTQVEGVDTYRFGVNPSELEVSPASACYDQFYYGALLNLSRVAFAEGFVTAKYFYPMKPDQTFLPGHAPYRGSNGAPTDIIPMLNFTLTDAKNPKPTHIQHILKTQATDDDYSSHLDVHPLTGSTLSARSRLQINTVLKPIDMDGCVSSFSDMMPQERQGANGEFYTSYFPQTAFPVLLVDRIAEAPMPIIDFLNSNVITPLKILKIVGYVSFGLLFIVALVGGFFICRRCRCRSGHDDDENNTYQNNKSGVVKRFGNARRISSMVDDQIGYGTNNNNNNNNQKHHHHSVETAKSMPVM